MNKHGDPDTIDWKILREIQRDGRISNVELAGRVGLSPPPTLRRVQALEQAGLIAGYRAQLNRERLDYAVKMFVLVGLKSQAKPEMEAFERQVKTWPVVANVMACRAGLIMCWCALRVTCKPSRASSTGRCSRRRMSIASGPHSSSPT